MKRFLTTRAASTTPRNSIFTMPRPNIRAFFIWFPKFPAEILKHEKRYPQTSFSIQNKIQRKTYAWKFGKIGREEHSEKLLQTKRAVQKPKNRVQLNFFSE